MLAVSAQEMLSIQADAYAATCDLPCVVTRGVRTLDANGRPVVTPSTIATVQAGMSQPSDSVLANYGYLVGSLSAWTIRFAVGTDIQEQDTLTIKGEVLTVKKVLAPRSYQALLSVLATEV